ncbi:MAG: DUF3152 domain-containing protein [Candidatus Corynebacterium faecigallinarum]
MTDPGREPVRRERFTLPSSELERRADYRERHARERERRQRRNRWIGVSGVLVALTTIGVVIELAVNSGGGSGGDDAVSSASSASGSAANGGDGGDSSESAGPVPGTAPATDVGELPAGGEFISSGDGTFHGVGTAGATAGDVDGLGDETYTYVVELEDGVNGSSFGGGDAFSATVDAVLGDPRSWVSTGDYAFEHISVRSQDTPDLRVRLASPETTVQLCGGTIDRETSCFIQGPDDEGEAGAGRVIINLARWVRGSGSFEGDLGGYRQYVLNHEIGHGIGFAVHQPCPEDGALAPLMMQQTLSLNNGDLEDLDAGAEYGGSAANNTCRPNAWPFPHGRSEGEAVDVRD